MTFSPLCLCGDMQSQHKMGKGGCRGDDCGCDRYEEDAQATADARVEFEFDQRHSTETAEPDTLSTSARLAKAEQLRAAVDAQLVTTLRERDEARAAGYTASTALVKAEQERAEALSAFSLAEELRLKATAELEKLRAEVRRASKFAQNLAELGCPDPDAHSEVDQLRALLARVETAAGIDPERDRGVDLADRVQSIRDGRTDAIGHFVDVVGQRDVLASHQRYLCETCGARYGIAYTDHEHGPLTPVTVTIARQGAPTA